MIMRLIGKICLLVGLALFFTNCHGAKYHYKNGKRYAEARMLKESVTSYKKAIDRRPSKTKFRIAMDQAGTALLEELYTNYRFADGDDSVSVYKFLEAEKWRTYLKPYINTSTFEGFYERDYQEQLSRFLEAKYNRSQKWIRTREFERAQKNLEEIKSLSPDYKDVQALLEFSEVEPIYVSALELFEKNEFREVHEMLQPTLKKYPNQEMLLKLEEQAIERGKYRLGIISDPNITGSEATMSAALQSATISLIQRNRDPFLELLDRTNFDMLRQEQEAIIQGTTNEAAVTQEILAADAYLKVIITHVYEHEGTLNRSTKRGWEQYFVTVKNDEGEEEKKAA
jgi:tetratricopeptide (TPR) repeat protein